MRIASILVALLFMAPAVAADWPSFHGDQYNSGHARDSNYEVYVDVWWNNKTEGGAQIKASPVLKDNILIIADSLGLVRALDSESGEERWRHKMGSGVEGTPAIEADRVYVADKGGSLVALNLKNGNVEDSASVGATRGSPTVHENKLYIGNEAGQMKSYLADSLTLLWTFSVTQPQCTPKHSAGAIRGAPVVSHGKVFFGSLNHHFYAVDEQGNPDKTTNIMWWAKTDDVIVGSPALLAQGFTTQYVVVGSYDGHVYRFVPTASGEGESKCGASTYGTRTYEVPAIQDQQTAQRQVSKVHSSPAVTPNMIVVGANNGNLYGLRPDDMKKMWEQEETGTPNKPLKSSPAVANGVVVVGSNDNKVFWIDLETGDILKTFTTESAVETSAAIDGDRAFLASTDGTLYMFGPKLPPRPDLVVDRIHALPERIEVTVKNDGEAPAEGSAVRLFLNGNFLTNLAHGDLESGATEMLETNNTRGYGEYTIRAVVDADAEVLEAHESNNELSRNVALEEPAPDNGGNDNGGGNGDPGNDPGTDPEPDEDVVEIGSDEEEGTPGIGIAVLVVGLLALALRRRW